MGTQKSATLAKKKMNSKLFLISALAAVALGQEDNFECPDEFLGFYPHLYSCDKYWFCEDGIAELRTCGNGLAFIDTDESYELEQCNELHLVDCGARTELEPPISHQTVLAYTEHMLILKTVVSSGTVRMEKPTDTNAHLDLPLTRSPMAASGQMKFRSVQAQLSPLMRKAVNLLVPSKQLQEFSLNILILLTADSTSCALMVYPENKVVLSAKFSMLVQVLAKTASAQTLNLYLSVLTIMGTVTS